jgi:hypothetical protein
LPGAGAGRLGLPAESAFQLKPGGQPLSALQKSCKLKREAALIGRLPGAWAVAENGTAIRQKYLVARPTECPLCGEQSACVNQLRIPVSDGEPAFAVASERLLSRRTARVKSNEGFLQIADVPDRVRTSAARRQTNVKREGQRTSWPRRRRSSCSKA